MSHAVFLWLRNTKIVKNLLIIFCFIPINFYAQSLPCDTNLWQHIYKSARLRVLEECKAVTGIVIWVHPEPDGDYHIRLKLDTGQESLLNTRNIEKQYGCLVLEIICARKVIQKDAASSCAGFINNVQIPQKGEHIKVIGSYVLDIEHGWNELHPVTSIYKL